MELSDETVRDCRATMELETEEYKLVEDALRESEDEARGLEARSEEIADRAVAQEIEAQTRLVEYNRGMEELLSECQEQGLRLSLATTISRPLSGHSRRSGRLMRRPCRL